MDPVMQAEELARARSLTRPSNLERGRVGARTWYRMQNLAADETEVFVYDEIGLWGVSADDFVRDLTAVTTPKIRLRVNSPGGDVFDGIAIYNAVATHPATVTAVVDGLAASAASFIVCAADATEIHRNAQMMVHDARGICIGNAADMSEMLDLLNLASDNIADIYEQKTGTPAAEWRTVMQAERWYSAQDAKDAGLADTVLTAGKAQPDEESEEDDEPVKEDDDLEDMLRGLDLSAVLTNAFNQEGPA